MANRSKRESVRSSRGQATREALLDAAMTIFARDGFDAVSTRQLAASAKVNQALIGYHFGGKQGLYLAVFDHICSRMRGQVGHLADQLQANLAQAPKSLGAPDRRTRFLPLLLEICDGMLSLMLSDETQTWSQLIIREQQQPTDAFERLYEGFMSPLLDVLTRLVQYLRQDSDQSEARIIVTGIIGQILVWRAARHSMMRLMKWDTINEPETARARRALHRGVTALVFA